MTLATSSEVLLIIVSTVLSIFLIVGIFVLVKLYQVLSTLKRVTDAAEKIADSAEAAAEFFRQSTGPAAVIKAISSLIEKVNEHKHKDK